MVTAPIGGCSFSAKCRHFVRYRYSLSRTEVPGDIWRKPKIDTRCLGSQQCVTPGRDEALVCHVAFRSLPQTTVSVASRIGA